MEQVRYGIVGFGVQGSFYAKDILLKGKVENAVLSAVCDIDPKAIEAAEKLCAEAEKLLTV